MNAPKVARPSMALALRNVTVRYGDREVLRDVTLEIGRGEVLGVLGPSGAGKSTLFRVASGEVRPDRGTVQLDGVDVTAQPLWRRARYGLGYMPQEPSVLADLTVAQNVETFLRLGSSCGAPSAQSRAARPGQRVTEWLDRLDLGARRSVVAGRLSAGERRRLELLRCLLAEPRALICDEPFAGVDPKNSAILAGLLRTEADRGMAVVFADHHVEEALGLCTRAALLLDGTVAAEGFPAEFRQNPLVSVRYLGTWRRTIPPSSVPDPPAP